LDKAHAGAEDCSLAIGHQGSEQSASKRVVTEDSGVLQDCAKLGMVLFNWGSGRNGARATPEDH
jgi:hypothetical protein